MAGWLHGKFMSASSSCCGSFHSFIAMCGGVALAGEPVAFYEYVFLCSFKLWLSLFCDYFFQSVAYPV